MKIVPQPFIRVNDAEDELYCIVAIKGQGELAHEILTFVIDLFFFFI